MKDDFPFFSKRPELTYLDSAATTQKPRVVLDEVRDFYENQNANPGRGLYDLGYEATELHGDCRQAVAEFLNTKSEQVIFTSGCTEGLNLVALWADSKLKPGDEIAISVYNHHSNLVPWQKLAERTEVKLKFFCRPTVESLTEVLSERTHVVVIPQVSNVTGELFPVQKMARLVHGKGALIICDSAQAVAHFKVNAKALEVDFLAFSGHKMYAPMGTGALYVKNPEQFAPAFYGGGAVEQVTKAGASLAPDISRFEPGTRNLAGEVGLKAAAGFVGRRGLSSETQRLVQLAHDKLSELPFVEVISPRQAIGMVSFNLYCADKHAPENLIHAHDVATILNDEGVCVRAGNHCAEPLMKHLRLVNGCCRASFGVYNDKNDVEKLVSAVKKAWEVLK